MAALSSWQPVLPSHELRTGENIVAGFLQGEEIALWRSVDGVAQAWENRCPHRGTRLTLGRIQGGRLACAYHGWEFEAGSGACALIPAQPQAAVPQNVCVKTWRASEAQGMVWVSASAVETAAPELADRPAREFCRSLSVRVAADSARRSLRALGFAEAEPFVWQGRLAGHAVTVYFNEAQPAWVFLHLFADAAALAPVMAASRGLRALTEGEGT